ATIGALIVERLLQLRRRNALLFQQQFAEAHGHRRLEKKSCSRREPRIDLRVVLTAGEANYGGRVDTFCQDQNRTLTPTPQPRSPFRDPKLAWPSARTER